MQARDGNFYDTTTSGGIHDVGTIYRLTPSGVFTNLRSFDGADGCHPFAGLLQAADGSFYGTTGRGGSAGDGTLFRLVFNEAHKP